MVYYIVKGWSLTEIEPGQFLMKNEDNYYLGEDELWRNSVLQGCDL